MLYSCLGKHRLLQLTPRPNAAARIRSPGDLLAQQKDAAGARLYNPYAGLGNQGFDLSRTLLELPDAPEFVFSEEALVRHRGWSENLTYITGGAYMGGAFLGGAYGGYKGLTTKVEGIADNTKLRINRVLNSGGKTGRNLGNTLGVLGLFYSSFESLAGYVREEHDSWNSIVAAGGTGAVYKSVSGPRAAAVWGAGCAVPPPARPEPIALRDARRDRELPMDCLLQIQGSNRRRTVELALSGRPPSAGVLSSRAY